MTPLINPKSPRGREKYTQPLKEIKFKSKSPSVKVPRSRSKGLNLTSSSFADDIKSMKSDQRNESEMATMSRTDLVLALKQTKDRCAILAKQNKTLVNI